MVTQEGSTQIVNFTILELGLFVFVFVFVVVFLLRSGHISNMVKMFISLNTAPFTVEHTSNKLYSTSDVMMRRGGPTKFVNFMTTRFF